MTKHLLILVAIGACSAQVLAAQAAEQPRAPITEEEIEARTRPGTGGAIIGGLLGASLGLFLGLGADLSGENLEGRGEAGPLIGAAVGGAIGAFAGARLTRVTREEAIEDIEEERQRSGRAYSRPTRYGLAWRSVWVADDAASPDETDVEGAAFVE